MIDKAKAEAARASLATVPVGMERVQRQALTAGIAGLIGCAIGAFLSPPQFFYSYLTAFVFWTGIALGCLAIVMLHHLSGGAWGMIIRRLLESGARTLPLLAVLFVPVAFGLTHLYEWARPAAVQSDALLQAKQPYLNVPFFLARAAIYFAAWVLVSYLLNKWSGEQDRAGAVAPEGTLRRFRVLSAPGLMVYGLTVTFASIDWVMSLDARWFSTIFGVLFMGGQAVSALAFVIAVLVLLARVPPLADVLRPGHLHDLGKLLLAFVMLWTYFAFSQWLIIWSGNLPEEVPWYLRRLQGGWEWVGLLLILGHFVLPFLLLLSRDAKRHARTLAAIAIGVVAMRFVDLFWMIAPERHPSGFMVHPLDIAALVGVGGLWVAYFVRQLGTRALLPVNDPYLREALEVE